MCGACSATVGRLAFACCAARLAKGFGSARGLAERVQQTYAVVGHAVLRVGCGVTLGANF